MRNLIIAATLGLILAGCSSTPTQESTAPVEDRSATAGATNPGGAATNGAGTGGINGSATGSGSMASGGNPLRDPNSPLAKRSVYFDYDSNSVKDEYRNLVQAHSRYMTADKRDSRMRIEGNCDERGSREYNLALGQRRAEAVKRTMTVLGAPDASIETVSFGEEKPVASGHDEQSWAQNRRADIKYAGE